MTKETYAGVAAVLKKTVGNANDTLLLERIVFWNTRQKGGVMHEGRMWSYREQKEWIEIAGLKERTGKRCWARLAESGFILTEMRWGGPHGNRRYRMHVALSDKTYDLLGGTHLQMAATKAELALADYTKVALKKKAAAADAAEKMSWEELMADPGG
jgi:hypothetical protein